MSITAALRELLDSYPDFVFDLATSPYDHTVKVRVRHVVTLRAPARVKARDLMRFGKHGGELELAGYPLHVEGTWSPTGTIRNGSAGIFHSKTPLSAEEWNAKMRGR